MATAEMPRVTFAEALRKARSKKGITQRALARALRISPSVVRLWESGRRVPDVEMAATIAQALAISVQELVAFDPLVPANKFVCMPCNTPMQSHGPDKFECPACKFVYDANRLRGSLEAELSKVCEAVSGDSSIQSLALDVKRVFWSGKITSIEYNRDLERQMLLALEQEKLLAHLGYKNPTRTARLIAQLVSSTEKYPHGLAILERVLPAIKTMLTGGQ